MNILARQAPACAQFSCPSLTTKPWWFVCGGARSRREKIQLKSCWGGCWREKVQKFFSLWDTLARSYSKFFLPGASLVLPKCTNFRQNVLIPFRELLARKKSKFSSQGCPGKKKYDFLAWKFLATHRPDPTSLAKCCRSNPNAEAYYLPSERFEKKLPVGWLWFLKK